VTRFVRVANGSDCKTHSSALIALELQPLVLAVTIHPVEGTETPRHC
jgi:hypothetical protein